MKPVPAILCLLSSAALFPAAILAANESDPTVPVSQAMAQTDSPIVSKIRAEMSSQHVPSMTGISVDADSSGVVSLTGTALSQDDVDKVVTIAHNTAGVTAVNNNVTVKAD